MEAVWNLIKNKKALSPIIATVILVSVTIVVAISVAYWMGSLSGTYTRFENVEITSVYANKVTFATGPYNGSAGWNITLTLKNSGSADATLDNVFVNAKPFNIFDTVTIQVGASFYNKTEGGALAVALASGASQNVFILIKDSGAADQGVTFVAGLTLDIKLHSAAGKEYPKLIQLV